MVTDSDGVVFRCGKPQAAEGRPQTELRIFKETFWVRALLFADMVRFVAQCRWETLLMDPGRQGFAESFMLGEIACPDLVAFFQVCISRPASVGV